MAKPLRYAILIFFWIALINFVFVFFSNLISNSFSLQPQFEILLLLLSSILGAILITVVVIFSAPVLKDFLVTYRRYLRLESLSNPVLLKLSKEAAGTYHHSLNVAILASKAAKAIGADSLIARLGGYYHDIGKLENPAYFVENQNTSIKNGLEQLPPQKSAKILTSHVKEGLNLSRKFNLPENVTDLISQHHGTALIAHFFQKAQKKGLEAQKKDFSYPGPKPLSKEAGILMIADAVEAKTRLIKEPNAENIRAEIEKIILERQRNNQLELSTLSSLDLKKITASLQKTILEMRHQRIPYHLSSSLRVTLKPKNEVDPEF